MGLGSKPCGDRSPGSHARHHLPFLFIGLSSSSFPAMQPASPAFLKTLSSSLQLTSDFPKVLSLGPFLSSYHLHSQLLICFLQPLPPPEGPVLYFSSVYPC